MAELLGTRHVERAGLEGNVRDHGAAAEAPLVGLELADAGNDARRSLSTLDRLLDGNAETRELHRIGRQKIGIEWVEGIEEFFDKGFNAGIPLRLLGIENVLDLQIVVRNRQTVPEVLPASDVARIDPAIVFLGQTRSAHEGRNQSLEHDGHHNEQRVRNVRETGLLPFLNGFEECIR